MNAMTNQEKILNFMRFKGPVLPVHIAKEINCNILFASAHLAEMVSSSKVKISSIKVGGSPLYYLPGQEERLHSFSDNLHDKEKMAFELLARHKILRDRDVEPIIRVTLREIKDFAVPLEVNHGSTKEIFWRWHMVSNDEAKQGIQDILTNHKTEVLQEKPVAKIPEEKEIKPIAPETQPKSQLEAKKDAEAKKLKDAEKAINEQKKIIEIEKKRIESEKKKLEKDKIKLERQMELMQNQAVSGKFMDSISAFFEQKKIQVLENTVIRKNNEFDFIIRFPSAIGEISYYCRAKNKKKVNEADLSQAFLSGQSKKLPVMFITTGELTKRSLELLEKDFKGMTFIKI